MRNVLVVFFLGVFLAGAIQGLALTSSNSGLSKQEIKDLQYMREEEKLARDVYLTLGEKWDLQVFKNISNSETKHTLAIKALLDRYQLEDPVKNDARGVFSNKHLRELYQKLIKQGQKSRVEALKVGALVEDLDIKDLQDALARTDKQDIRFVYSNLKRGSENHLRAFMRMLKLYGGQYFPKYISKQEFDSILAQDFFKGKRRGRGMGRGGRQGNTPCIFNNATK